MALIRMSEVTPGQVVSEDVKDRSGRILLSANSRLTEDSIKILKSWGVHELLIDDESATETSINTDKKANAQINQKLANELSQRFRFLNMSHPFIAELYEVCMQRKLEAKDNKYEC